MRRGHQPVRMCVICRQRMEQHALTRHTLGDEPAVLLSDGSKPRPGRGWYVCAQPLCREKFARYRAGRRKKS